MAKTGSDDATPAVLLDTCALIFIAMGRAIDKGADEMVGASAKSGSLYVSPVSAWELGMGASRGRLALSIEPLSFFKRFLVLFAAKLVELTPEILIHSSFLPGEPHKDPMDRMLIATARLNNLVLVTSDRSILRYGKAGHVQVLAC